jgi:hypothetical protein
MSKSPPRTPAELAEEYATECPQANSYVAFLAGHASALASPARVIGLALGAIDADDVQAARRVLAGWLAREVLP